MLETLAEDSGSETSQQPRGPSLLASLLLPTLHDQTDTELLKDFKAIRTAERTCIENLTWSLLHLKKSVGKSVGNTTWQEERDAADRAMEEVGIVWGDIVNKKVASNLDDAIDDYKQTAHRLKSIRNIFRDYLDELDEQLETLRTHMQPRLLSYGIDRVPDEVLSMIFENVVQDQSVPMHLAGVCQRFRRVALGTSTLWRRITGHMTEDHAWFRLQRSGNVGLQVTLCAGACNSCKSTVTILSQHYRWKTLSLDIEYPTSSNNSPERWLLSPLYLPTLTHLKLDCVSALDGVVDEGEIEFEESIENAITSSSRAMTPSHWSMPNLQHLSIRNFIPENFPYQSLKSLSVHLSSSYPLPMKTYNRIHAILNQTSSLETFSYTVDFSPVYHFEPPSDAELGLLTLDQLTRLVVSFTPGATNPNEFMAVEHAFGFTETICVPKLEEMKVLFSSDDSDCLIDFFGFFSSLRWGLYANLRCLEIVLFTSSSIDILRDVFSNMPQIQEITLSGKIPGIVPQSLVAVQRTCSLRKFILRRVEGLSPADCFSLLQLFTKQMGHSFPSFEWFIIRGCPQLSPEVFKYHDLWDSILTDIVEWVL